MLRRSRAVSSGSLEADHFHVRCTAPAGRLVEATDAAPGAFGDAACGVESNCYGCKRSLMLVPPGGTNRLRETTDDYYLSYNMEKTKQQRLELMKERKYYMQHQEEQDWKQRMFFPCEH